MIASSGRTKFFETVIISEELVMAGGLQLVKNFLEKELGEDDFKKQVRNMKGMRKT